MFMRALSLMLLTGLLIAAPPAGAQTWQGALQRGGAVSVDGTTRRPVIEQGGVSRPLWDGVHRLQDGSTLIVRDGVAVPTADMLRAWEAGPVPEPTYADRPCDQLVRKTCGFDQACANAAACLTARTLLADEVREQRGLPIAAGSHPSTETSDRCRAALSDPTFPPCASLTRVGGDSRCRALVTRVCGPADQCAASPACNAAQQLLTLETDERLGNDDPAAVSTTGRQCLEADGNPFFATCSAGAAEPR